MLKHMLLLPGYRNLTDSYSASLAFPLQLYKPTIDNRNFYRYIIRNRSALFVKAKNTVEILIGVTIDTPLMNRVTVCIVDIEKVE